MALQQPLWSQIPAVQTTQLPAPNLLGAAGGSLYPPVMSQGRNANSSASPEPRATPQFHLHPETSAKGPCTG